VHLVEDDNLLLAPLTKRSENLVRLKHREGFSPNIFTLKILGKFLLVKSLLPILNSGNHILNSKGKIVFDLIIIVLHFLFNGYFEMHTYWRISCCVTFFYLITRIIPLVKKV
jgi:hypothetical protein